MADPVRVVGAVLIVGLGAVVTAGLVKDDDGPAADVAPPVVAPQTPQAPAPAAHVPPAISITTAEIADDPTSTRGAARIESVKAASLAVANECGHLPLWSGASIKIGGYVDGKTRYVNVTVDVRDTVAVRGNTLWYRVRLDGHGEPISIKPEKQISADACMYADALDDVPLGHLSKSAPSQRE